MANRSVYWLIPIQWVAHFADEWAFGFPAWATRHFAPLPDSRWLPGMAILTGVMILLARVASKPDAGERTRLLCAGVQMVFFANAFFHAITTFAFAEYSPGTATGVLLYLPLSPLVWRNARRDACMTRGAFSFALIAGFLVHGLVVLSLFVDKSGG